ncbi:MAG: hypothetical protein KDD01_23720 [Phaeodactylibacter sp.]|nr:hypothetical protein [Phaeodactylibacter sp.]
MIKAAVIDNGIVGLRDCFRDNDKVQYHYLEVDGHSIPDFSPYELLVVPNGTDQVTEWLCGMKPEGAFEIRSEDYGVESMPLN